MNENELSYMIRGAIFKVILEIKSVDELADVHHKQLLTYLKVTGVKLGLLINFNSSDLNKSIVRIANKL